MNTTAPFGCSKCAASAIHFLPWNDSPVVVVGWLGGPDHGVGLAGSRLPVGHHRHVGRVVDKLGHQVLHRPPVHRRLYI